MMLRSTPRQAGFTLVELLVAMALTVLIGSVAYRFLDSAISVHEQGVELLDELAKVDRFWSLLASDLAHAAPRPAPVPATGTDRLGLATTSVRPAMISADGVDLALGALVQRPGAVLWMTRQAWDNPLQVQRSQLQRVLYRLEDGLVFRDYSPERNQALDETPTGSLLLIEGVENFGLRFLAPGQPLVEEAWQPAWPGQQQASATDEDEPALLPVAVEVTLRSQRLGELRRLFLLPGI